MVDDGDDDDDLSGFLLSLAISCSTLGGSWVLDFHHWWYYPAGFCAAAMSNNCDPLTAQSLTVRGANLINNMWQHPGQQELIISSMKQI